MKDEDSKNHPQCCSSTTTPATIDYLLQDINILIVSSPMSHPISVHRNSHKGTIRAIDNTHRLPQPKRH
ncbi:hypothetical protein PGTUg99_000204 [Puccinia graminis f. sp. tritici]|uniref:Uncharacterized protein n=1 Tax=Puccinia graminis f. sp. tritici TaxID=56615 RepID=A0A5B0NLX1_PUCGR|nr:hypothetical protein PGTUg99_000204 [Puccinia graminis f. sp. tritici]